MATFHPTALVDPQAEIDSDVEIGPYCIVEKGTRLGAGVRLHAHVIIKTGTTLAGDNQVDAFTVLGGTPQDFNFIPGSPTLLEIGKGTTIREGVIMHGSTRPDQPTRVGEYCYAMNQAHVGHDAQIGNRVILSAGCMAGGFTTIEDYAVIGGMAAIHQWGRVGEGSMVGGLTRVSKDIPPFLMVAERSEASGLNLVGLRRRGVPRETITELKTCFHETVQKRGNLIESATRLLASHAFSSREALHFLQFLTVRGRPIAQFRQRDRHA